MTDDSAVKYFQLVLRSSLIHHLQTANNPPIAYDLNKMTLHLHPKFYVMGRGDKKTKKGKIFKGSFGKSRPAGEKKITGTTPAAPKKEA